MVSNLITIANIVVVNFYTYGQMLNQTIHPSFYRITSQQYHKSFIESLLMLQEVSAPEAKELYIKDIKNIYAEAKAFLADNSDYLCVQSLSLLQHIVARDLDLHLMIANVNSNNLIKSN